MGSLYHATVCTMKAKKKLNINGKTLSGSRHLKVSSSWSEWNGICTDNFHLDFINKQSLSSFIQQIHANTIHSLQDGHTFFVVRAHLRTDHRRSKTFCLRKKLWIYKQGLDMIYMMSGISWRVSEDLMMFWCHDTVDFFAYLLPLIASGDVQVPLELALEPQKTWYLAGPSSPGVSIRSRRSFHWLHFVGTSTWVAKCVISQELWPLGFNGVHARGALSALLAQIQRLANEASRANCNCHQSPGDQSTSENSSNSTSLNNASIQTRTEP